MQIQELLDRIDEAALRAKFTPEPVGLIQSFKIKAYVREVGPEFPKIYISAGVHGDEPAGPLAVLRMLRNNAFPIKANLYILPVINPCGLELKTRTNPHGIDINRDYGPAPESNEATAHLAWLDKQQFDLALCLHEDSDGEGFYLYELASHIPKLDLVTPTFSEVRKVIPIDLRTTIDDMPANMGIMIPPAESHQPDRLDMPEALRLYFRHTPLCYTFETPSRLSVPSRVDAQVVAIHSMLNAYLQQFEKEST